MDYGLFFLVPSGCCCSRAGGSVSGLIPAALSRGHRGGGNRSARGVVSKFKAHSFLTLRNRYPGRNIARPPICSARKTIVPSPNSAIAQAHAKSPRLSPRRNSSVAVLLQSPRQSARLQRFKTLERPSSRRRRATPHLPRPRGVRIGSAKPDVSVA